MKTTHVISILLVAFLASCGLAKKEAKLDIAYEKFTLDNGLQVILHEDKSDPIVAVSIAFHVGSNRETPGRTGFAHFFEHMLFQRSENLPRQSFFKKINEFGGTFNGGTWNDGTIYFETVPKDALEKVLWMESDRMGFFINTVSSAGLEKEKGVVKNEKRQRVDNQPYGHTNYVINKALYPKEHPYNWTVIGELEDLQNATIDDVKDFYKKWYGPNNATLVIAGDIDKSSVKELVDKYFGELKTGPTVETIQPMPGKVAKTVDLYHEDEFAKTPELRMVFPTVENYHADQYALDILANILSNGKSSQLHKVVVEEKKLAPNVRANHPTLEVSGTFRFTARAFEGKNLNDVKAAIFEAMNRFEEKGVSDKDLQRIKNLLETQQYGGLTSVMNKAQTLSVDNAFTGNPKKTLEGIDALLAVTKEDVMRVYKTYIKGKNYISTSFIPKGKKELIITGSTKAFVKEEDITKTNESKVTDVNAGDEYERTPSSFDRSVEPPYGEKPNVTAPKVWTKKLDNGLTVYGLEHNELPLINFRITLKGGHLLDDPKKVGVANLMTDIMQEGTKNKTPEALETAIDMLGATINMFTGNESITITGNCLSRNYKATLALVEEMLLEPRWDSEEFDRIKKRTLNQIVQGSANPNTVARNAFNKVVYGDEHILSSPAIGTTESVESIVLDDLKTFYEKNFSPSVSSFKVAGFISQDDVISSLSNLEKKWASKKVDFPQYELPTKNNGKQVFFVDIPNAKQSVLLSGNLSIARNNSEYRAANMANYRLGAGSAGKLFQVLREEKSYTYGAYSFYRAGATTGTYLAQSSVRTDVTLESAELFKSLIGNYSKSYTEEDLEKTKSAILKSNARAYETINNLMGVLNNIADNGLPLNYLDKEQRIVENMNFDQIKKNIDKFIDPNKMFYLVVGDAKTQKDRLKKLGYGDPIMLDRRGNRFLDEISDKSKSPRKGKLK